MSVGGGDLQAQPWSREGRLWKAVSEAAEQRIFELEAENERLRKALASDARVEAILAALLIPRGDPEDGPRDHLPRVLRNFLSEECGRAGRTGFDDGYAEGFAKATSASLPALDQEAGQ